LSKIKNKVTIFPAFVVYLPLRIKTIAQRYEEEKMKLSRYRAAPFIKTSI